jgi:GxxExxY protein
VELDQITEKIIGCAYEVGNTLGSGFVEQVYENSLFYQLVKSNLHVVQQHQTNVFYDNVLVREFFADLLVEQKVLMELKAVRQLEAEETFADS